MSVFELVDDDTDLTTLLEPVAAAVPLVEAAWLDLLLAEAAVHFDEHQHPRWPKGTPKGGQFIRVGQSFGLKGHQYEVAHVVKGKIYAHLKGGKQAQTIEVHTTKTGGFAATHPAEVHVAHIEAPTPTGVKGGKGQESTVTAVDPYVDSASHDPSIPIPVGSKITPSEWQRFGKVDQEHYTELQERFGSWKPAAAKPLVDKAYTDYQAQLIEALGPAQGKAAAAAAAQAVKTGYSMQYGSSSGTSLSLIGAIKKLVGGHGKELSPAEHDARERAMVLQGEHKAAVQWDLYNRSHSPDISAFHKNSESTAYWDDGFIKGTKRIFSGLSQSFHYRASFFGDNALATPLSIRHILLASQSAQPIPGSSHFPGELEISVPEQMLLDKRSLTFTFQGNAANGKKLSHGAKAWLENVTKAPVGGKFIEQLRAHFEKGEELPIPPEPAMIHMDGAGSKLWKDPEPEAWKGLAERAIKTAGGGDMNVGDHFRKDGKSFKVTKIDSGGTAHGTAMSGTDTQTVGPDEQVPHAQSVQTAGIKVGDYVMGLQGARYVVVADPADPSGYGLTYVEGNNSGPTGNSFHLKPGGARQFYRLEGSYQAKPVAVEGKPAFDAGGWTQGADEPKLVAKLNEGDKFKVEGTVYEVMGQLPNEGKTRVRDMDTGKLGKINQSYKTPILVPKEGYVPPPPEGSLVPQAGDFVAIDGEKWEVQGLQKTGAQKGMWKLKRPGKPGMTFVASDSEHLKNLHRPGDYVIGAKEKLRDIPVGEKFHVGAGAKQKPYQVVSHGGPGKKSVVLDLSTGQKHEVSRNASYSRLVAPSEAPMPAPESPKGTPKGPGSPHDPTGYVLSGETVQAGDLPDGAKFQTGSGDQFQKIGGLSGDYFEVTNLLTGEQKSMLKLQPAQHLVPKSETATPHAQLTKGDHATIDTLSPGDQFEYEDGSTGLLSLVSLSDTGGSPMVAHAHPDGTLGAPYELPAPQSDSVIFQKHAADPTWLKSNPASAGLAETDPGSLPPPPDFAAYGSAYATGAKEKGGFSGKHHRVSEMATGQVFRDKGGKLWKVKSAGSSPVITDGKANYQVDGQLRGRASTVLTDLPNGDTSPALGQPGVDTAKAGMEHALNPNIAGLTMSQMKKGDLFTYQEGGAIHSVVGPQGDGMSAVTVDKGNGKWVPNDFTPSHVALAEAPPAPASALTPDQILQTAHAIMSPNAAGATAASLHPDDLLDGPPKSFSSQRAVFKVSAITPEGKIQAYDIVNGALHTFDPGYTPKAVWMKNPLPPVEPDPVIPSYDGIKLEVGGGAGGSTGAKIATAADGTKYLLKTYSGNQDRVATELAANAIYRAMGIKVPDAGTYTMPDGTNALAYPLLDGEPHKITSPSEVIGQGFMTDALVANWDFIGLVDDNILWGPDGVPFRVDQGGTLQYRAQGAKKDFGPVPSEVWSMMSGGGQGVGKVKVTTEQKQQQAAQIAATLTPAKIDEIVTSAPFKDKAMRNEIRDALKARVDWMAAYAHGDVLEPGQTAAPKPKPSPPPTATSGMPLEATPLGEGISPNSGYLTLAQLAPGEVFQMHDSTALYQVQNQPSGTGTVAAKVISSGMDFGGDVGATYHLQAHKSPAGIGQPENVPGADPEGPPSDFGPVGEQMPKLKPQPGDYDYVPAQTREVGQLPAGAKFKEAGQTWTLSGTKVNQQIKATSDDGQTQFFHPLFVPEEVLPPLTAAEKAQHDEGFQAGVAKATGQLAGTPPVAPTYTGKNIKAPSDPLQAALAASLAAMGVSADSPAGIKALGNAPTTAQPSAQQLTLDQLKAKYGTLSALDYLPAAGKPFLPFKSAWGTGGKYKHPRVGELKFGEAFHDKTGSEWTYIAPHSADASVVQDEYGNAALLLNAFRVKRKADA